LHKARKNDGSKGAGEFSVFIVNILCNFTETINELGTIPTYASLNFITVFPRTRGIRIIGSALTELSVDEERKLLLFFNQARTYKWIEIARRTFICIVHYDDAVADKHCH
jgi:hypothetical protein